MLTRRREALSWLHDVAHGVEAEFGAAEVTAGVAGGGGEGLGGVGGELASEFFVAEVGVLDEIGVLDDGFGEAGHGSVRWWCRGGRCAPGSLTGCGANGRAYRGCRFGLAACAPPPATSDQPFGLKKDVRERDVTWRRR